MVIPVINRFLHWFKVGLVFPVFIILMISKGIPLERVGIVSVIMSVSVIVFEMPSGLLSDLFGRRRIYLLSLIFDLIGIGLVFTGENFLQLAIGFSFYGTARAFSSGSIESLYIDVFILEKGKAQLHKLITAINIGETAGLAIGALLGGLVPTVWKRLSPESNLYNGNLAMQIVISVFLILLTLLSPYKEQKRETTSVKKMLFEVVGFSKKSEIVKWLFLGTMVWGFVFNGIELFWQPHLKAIIGTEETLWIFGVISSGYFLAAILGSLLIGLILTRVKFSVYTVMAILRILLGTAIILLTLQNNLPGFTVFFLLIMCFNGMLNVPENTAFNIEVPGDKRASLLSMSSFLLQLGGAMGALFYSGVMEVGTIQDVWLIGGSVFGLSALIYIRLASKINKQELT